MQISDRNLDYDIIIIGGGPAGLSFACSLRHTDLRIAIIEKQSLLALEAPQFDGRDIALTHQSVRLLQSMGVWEKLAIEDKSPIKEAKVINGTSPYSLNFDTGNEDIDALGYLVSNHHIRKVLYSKALENENLDILAERAVVSLATGDQHADLNLDDGTVLSTALIVAADSRFSESRRMAGISASMHDFGRVCVVCRMEHEKPHAGIAYECFHYGRTLAVLPLQPNQSSIVVTAPMSERDSIMDMSEHAFSADIQQRFENRFGAMSLSSGRHAYPLVGVHSNKFHAVRFAVIGDAAVGMHPVTAHGFNLGLSGQEILSREIINSKGDLGDNSLLKRYETQHMMITRPMYHGTNSIVQLFTDDRAPTRLFRRAALQLANNLPPIRKAIRDKLTESQPPTFPPRPIKGLMKLLQAD